MKTTVSSGAALNLVSKALNLLFSNLTDALRDIDLKVAEEKDIEEDGVKGKYYLYEAGDNHTLEVKLFTIEDHPDMYVVRVQADGKEPKEAGPMKKEDIIDYITSYADSHDLGTVADDPMTVTEGSKISITLQRVTSNTSTDTISLSAIQASTNAGTAILMLREALDDEEFTDSITEDPHSFEIVSTNDGYDVSEINSVDTSDTYEKLLQACIECAYNLRAIHWGAKSSRFQEVHNYVESLYYDISYQEDKIAEWCVQKSKRVPNVLSYQYDAIDTSNGFDFEHAMKAAKHQLDNYIAALECYYVNVDHTIQSVVDSWIETAKMRSEYMLERMLLPDDGPIDSNIPTAALTAPL